jgi:hypothetical protein
MPHCYICGQEKAAEDFYKSRRNVSGLSSRCRPCEHRRSVLRRRERCARDPEYHQRYNRAQNARFKQRKKRAVGVPLDWGWCCYCRQYKPPEAFTMVSPPYRPACDFHADLLLHPQGAVGWSKHYDRCQQCLTTMSPHHALGLCKRCYKQHRRESAKPTSLHSPAQTAGAR